MFDNELYQLPPVTESFNSFDVTDPGLVDTTVGQAVTPTALNSSTSSSTSSTDGSNPTVLTPPPDLTTGMDTIQRPPYAGTSSVPKYPNAGIVISKGKSAIKKVVNKVTDVVDKVEQKIQAKPETSQPDYVTVTQFVAWMLVILFVVIVVAAFYIGGKCLYKKGHLNF